MLHTCLLFLLLSTSEAKETIDPNVNVPGCTNVTVSILTDSNPQDIGWEISLTNPPVSVPVGTYTESNTLYNATVCLEGGMTVQFVARDTTGDGWTTGGYTLYAFGAEVQEFYSVYSDQDSSYFDVPVQNINNPGCVNVTFFILTDTSPLDIGWELQSFPRYIVPAGTYTESDTLYSTDLCLKTLADYQFYGTDATGDGWTTGGYRISFMGSDLVELSEVWGDRSGNGLSVPEQNVNVPGCTNATIFITTDTNPQDIYWEIQQTYPHVGVTEGTYTENNTVYIHTACFLASYYFDITVYDASGDGWTDGGFRVSSMGWDVIQFTKVPHSLSRSFETNVPNVDVSGCYPVIIFITTGSNPQQMGWELGGSYPRVAVGAGGYTESDTVYNHTACLDKSGYFWLRVTDVPSGGWGSGGLRVNLFGVDIVPFATVTDVGDNWDFSFPEMNVDVPYCVNVTINITTDSSPQDIGWVLDGTFPLVAFRDGTYTQSNTEYSHTVCLLVGLQVTFGAIDLGGDGWTTGTFRLSAYGYELVPPTSVAASTSTIGTTVVFTVPELSVGVEGCTPVTVVITTDATPADMSWDLQGAFPRVSVSAGTYTESDTTYNLSTCLKPAGYTLVVKDSAPDGWNSGRGNVFAWNAQIGDIYPDGSTEVTLGFQVPERSVDVPGCTNLTVVITTDSAPLDMGFRIVFAYPPLYLDHGYFTESDHQYNVDICIQQGYRVAFIAFDEASDGWTTGGFQVFSYGEPLTAFQQVDGGGYRVDVTVPAPPPPSPSPSPASPSPSPVSESPTPSATPSPVSPSESPSPLPSPVSSSPSPPMPWTTIFRCNGDVSADRLLYSVDRIKVMAAAATQIRICTVGDSADCVTSKANSFPIQMLRLGNTISHNNGAPCNINCIRQTWTGPRLNNLLSKNGWGSGAGLAGDVPLYWASGNMNGLHISVKDRAYCGWAFGKSNNVELALNSAPASPLPSPGTVTWTRILKCNGATAINRLDLSVEAIKQLAVAATRIKICTAGDNEDCVVSLPNTFPIRMLRLGNTVSHNAGVSCTADCVKATWTGPRLGSLWSQGGNLIAGGGLTGQDFFYWASRNFQGLHLSAKNGGLCGWTYQASNNIEVFVDAA